MEHYAQFEAYAHGELAAPARAALAARLAADPALALAYAEFVELTDTLRAAGRHRAARRLVRGLHAAVPVQVVGEKLVGKSLPAASVASVAADTSTITAATAAASATETAPAANETLRRDLDALAQPAGQAQPQLPLRLSGTERRLRDFWQGHRATAGIAAAVAVLAVFGTLLGLEAWRAAKAGPALAGYQAMRRELNVLKRNQKALSRSISQLDAGAVPAAPVNNGKFSGTGFALTADGYLVTSYHVIQGADSLRVEGRDRRRYRAETVYADVAHDLAILRITDKKFDGFGRLPYTFKATEADLGERVYTLGYPREDVVYGEGALSARSGFEGDTAFYQVSIPVNPGNSGGPLLDERGNLIGVVSGRQNDAQGAGFATKSSYLVRLVDSLARARPAAPYHLPTANRLAGTGRPQQLKKLQDYVFVVKVFE